jgi:abortive infection bacteriophage resistance protein
VKLIPYIMPDYIPPLVDVVSRESITRDFDYTIITTYLLKQIRAVRPQLESISTLKINDNNLEDCKNYGMLTPYKYLTRTKGKKSKIIP